MNTTDFSCLDENVSRNSVTQDYWKIYEPFGGKSRAVAAVVIVYLAVGLSWNTFIAASLLWQKLIHQPAHVLLINLAVTDLLMCVCVMPFTIVSGIAQQFIFGSSDHVRCIVCQSGVVFTLLSCVSLHIIALLSLDRFLFISFPLHYHRYVTVRRTLVALVTVWLISIFLSIPPLFGFGEIKLSKTIGNCFLSFFGETHVTRNVYYITLLLIEALLPIGVLIVTNTGLLCMVQKHIYQILKSRHKLDDQQKELQAKKLQKKARYTHNRQQLQLLRVFGGILLVNIITWLPALGLGISALVVDFAHVSAEAIAFVYLAYISHPVLHPLLEACFIFEIRNLLTRLCTCGHRSLERRASLRTTSGGESRSAGANNKQKSSCLVHYLVCGCCDSCTAGLLP